MSQGDFISQIYFRLVDLFKIEPVAGDRFVIGCPLFGPRSRLDD